MKPSQTTKLVYAYVRKIINSAALCVEIEEYERAITSLGKALQILKAFIEGSRSETEKENDCYNCNHLSSLDECIRFSEGQHRNSHIHRTLRSMTGVRGASADNLREETIRKRFIHRRQHRCAESSGHRSSNFFHRRLIQVPPLSDHPCSSICLQQIINLSLISIFNHAVVCHIRAMDHTSYRSRDKSRGLSRQAINLQKALNLYEIVYSALQKRAETRKTSVQFGLILCNNLSHAHNLVGNRNKHERYLREVLSAIMSLVDSNQRNNQGVEESDKRRCNPWCIDLEGFMDNAFPLMTEVVCAGAA